MNENKVPCGGFRIGDGLTMDGDTLKSLGGAYVKIVVDKMPSSASEQVAYSFLDDSPIQNFTDLLSMSNIMPITLHIFLRHDSVVKLLNVFDLVASDGTIVEGYGLRVSDPNVLRDDVILMFSEYILIRTKKYTLTPAT